MEVMYYDVRKNDDLEKKTGARGYDAPEDILREADVVSVHLPLNDATWHFLNKARLSLMKQTAVLVNTSRGAVIEEEALIRILQNREIFGAGLDVFEDEPVVPRTLRQLPNTVLTPHIASASIGTRNKMADMVATNILAVLHGSEPPNRVLKQ